MIAEINGARIHFERSGQVIKNAVHLPSLERPDEFNRLMLDFLLS
ncbi:MAG TPA: hypothetical protein VEL12_13700 [Candidatus Nitrosopolaris sp.]|nr:hypothetical protein [Candidatus Nitrosopolaris sp.]